MPTLIWLSLSNRNGNLLDLQFTDCAEVSCHGRNVGRVFALTNGKYRASIEGIRGNDDYDTADEAAEVCRALHAEYGS